MATYKTPGVYVEEISTMPPSVAEVETAIPAFIGFTEKGILNSPKKITSLKEYEDYFGKAEAEKGITYTTAIIDGVETVTSVNIKDPSKNKLYYAMQIYYVNGGGPCYIVPTGDYSKSGGANKQTYLDALDASSREDEPTLLVLPDAPFILKAEDYYDVMNYAVKECTRLGDRFAIVDVVEDPTEATNRGLSVKNFRGKFGSSEAVQFKYAAAYFPYLNTSLGYYYNDTDDSIKPDGGNQDKPPRVPKPPVPAGGDAAAPPPPPLAAAAPAASAFSALNNLAKNQLKKMIENLGIKLTPCAAMAGVYASVDNARGVWKAPANVSLGFVNAVSSSITDYDQQGMNIDVDAGKSVNAIRFFPGKGVIVWGGRTLDGNSNEWRYINVRRFFNMVEESVKKSTYWAVFEANDRNTWVKVRAMIENYLILKWKDGALAGAKPDDAFFVRVGLGQTMSPQDVLEGRMIVEIGMAAVRPAEFIILKFSHKMQTT